jgi:hypothetical protein
MPYGDRTGELVALAAESAPDVDVRVLRPGEHAIF